MTDQEKEEFKNRFNSMIDNRLSFYTTYTDIPNMQAWLLDNLESKTVEEMETLISALEAKDTELQNSPEKKYADYIEARNKEYLEAGADINTIIEAIWENVIEGDSTKADLLQAKRLEVKTKIPKVEKPPKV